MRKEIREILERAKSDTKMWVDRANSEVEHLEKRLVVARQEHNHACNILVLIEEELQRPDGSPASEKTAPVMTDEGGSGI